MFGIGPHSCTLKEFFVLDDMHTTHQSFGWDLSSLQILKTKSETIFMKWLEMMSFQAPSTFGCIDLDNSPLNLKYYVSTHSKLYRYSMTHSLKKLFLLRLSIYTLGASRF